MAEARATTSTALQRTPGERVICCQFIFKPGVYDDDFHRLDGQIDDYARNLPGFERAETWRAAEGDIVNAIYYSAKQDSWPSSPGSPAP